jgi:hypothetical protein
MQINAVLRHSLAASAAAARHGLQASIELPSFSLHLHGAGAPQRWRPRFVTRMGAGTAYTDVPVDDTVGFAGWLPYGPRRWPEGSGKAAFRRFAQANGLPQPAACIDPADLRGPFLVKGEKGSFGRGQRGPFLTCDAFDPAHRLREGEYYENFVPGWMAKGWCWGASCIALDLQRPPTVSSDGRSTVRALAGALGAFAVQDTELLARLSAYCNVASIDEVLPEGREVLVHYRWGADPRQLAGAPGSLPPAPVPPGVQAQFDAAAQRSVACLAAAGLPAETLYTLDAVVDADGTTLFLEMNCNPLVHPAAYDTMVASAVAGAAPAPSLAAPARVAEPALA